MRYSKGGRFFWVLFISLTFSGIIGGCDSGKKTVEEVTGNRAVKQYHESKKELGKIADQQDERYRSIPEDDGQED